MNLEPSVVFPLFIKNRTETLNYATDDVSFNFVTLILKDKNATKTTVERKNVVEIE